jgi:PAS domain S-box-containing protein
MGNTDLGRLGPVRLRRYTWGLVVLWTAAVGATATWELVDERNHVLEVARGQARSALEKNLLFRRWGSSHGGVYVPVTEKTQPNPYLTDVPERDVVTSEGRRLTLVNPAFMMRQVNELAEREYRLRNHLTSLDPLNPENRPDRWEAEALGAFERGQEEVSSVEDVDQQPHMRMMRPVTTEQSCLECHSEQGYELGDVRGGMSVSVPMAPLDRLHRAEMMRRALGYGMMWLLGLGGIVVASRRLRGQIAHRQQAEEALQESQARIKETASHIPGVVYQFVLHPDGSYSFPYVSEGVTEILGLVPEEVQRDAAVLLPGLIFEEDLEPLWQSIYESAEKMATWQREMRCKSTDGETKWIRATSSPHSLPDGSVLWNGVFLDITDHKEADRRLQEAHDMLERRVAERTTELEEANRELHKEIADRKQAEKWLLESEERFRSFFELGVVGMAIVSPEKDWDEANHRLCEILGYSQEELIGKTWTELVHPEDREADESQFERALAGVLSEYSMHRRLVRKDGQIVHANLSVKCLRRADGAVDSLIVLVQDVSDRKRAEEEVKSIQARLLKHQQEG